MQHETSGSPASVGRPRDPVVDEAIISAAFDLIGEVGIDGFTVEAAAAKAGVGKSAIYRRYSNKTELALEAIGRSLPPRPRIDATAGTRRQCVDLVTYANGLFGERIAMFGAMLIARQREPELFQRFMQVHVMPRRAVMHDVIARGQQRGDLRGDVGIEALASALFGAVMERSMRGDTGEEVAEEIVDSLWPLIAARP